MTRNMISRGQMRLLLVGYYVLIRHGKTSIKQSPSWSAEYRPSLMTRITISARRLRCAAYSKVKQSVVRSGQPRSNFDCKAQSTPSASPGAARVCCVTWIIDFTNPEHATVRSTLSLVAMCPVTTNVHHTATTFGCFADANFALQHQICRFCLCRNCQGSWNRPASRTGKREAEAATG